MKKAILKKDGFWRCRLFIYNGVSLVKERSLINRFLDITKDWIIEYDVWCSSDDSCSKTNTVKSKHFIGDCEFEDER